MTPSQGNQGKGFPQTTLILLRVSSCGILGTLFGPDWQLKRRISFPPGGVIHYNWGCLLLRKQCVNKTKENVVPSHLPLMRHHSFVCSPEVFPNDKVGEGVVCFFNLQQLRRLWYQAAIVSNQKTLSTHSTAQASLHLTGLIHPYLLSQWSSSTKLHGADNDNLNQSVDFPPLSSHTLILSTFLWRLL